LIESVPTQLTAGIAKPFSFATAKTLFQSLPAITPGLTTSRTLVIFYPKYKEKIKRGE